jgi:hypothetical protein
MSSDTLPESVQEMTESSRATGSDQDVSGNNQMHSQGAQLSVHELRSWLRNHRNQNNSEQGGNSRSWLVRIRSPRRSPRHDQGPAHQNIGSAVNQSSGSLNQEQRVLHSDDATTAEGSQECVRRDNRQAHWSRLNRPLRWWPRRRTPGASEENVNEVL